MIKTKVFNAERAAEMMVDWTRKWFNGISETSKAVIGISGGKDSTITAAILCKALGPERVIGVMLPNGVQKDIDDSKRVFEFLGMEPHLINIESAINALYDNVPEEFKLNAIATTNTPPRIRLTTLYMVAACMGGFVVNTSNLSETHVGYFTKNADNRGDVALLRNYTCTEVIKIGHALGLPKDLVDKTPADGLCGKTDEDNIGISYADIDSYLDSYRYNKPYNLPKETIAAIQRKNKASFHKYGEIPSCPYEPTRTDTLDRD